MKNLLTRINLPLILILVASAIIVGVFIWEIFIKFYLEVL